MIRSQVRGRTLEIVISQPEKMNAINLAMWRTLAEVLTEAQTRHDISVVCLRGDGERAFCSGGDITEYESLSDNVKQAGQAYIGVRQVSDLLRQIPYPTIAGISGYCVGAGLVLATACDFRFCATSAMFSVTAVRRGLVYPAAAAGELIALVGLAKTRAILLRGQKMPAQAAFAAGLVDALVEQSEFEAKLLEFCAELERQSGDAYAATKLSIRDALNLRPESEAMRELNIKALTSETFRQSTRAFIRGDRT